MSRYKALATIWALLTLPVIVFGQSDWNSINNSSESDYGKWVGSLKNKHAVHVSVFGSDSAPRFAAISNDTPIAGWYSHHDMSEKSYQELFDKYGGEGYRLISISGYTKNKVIKYAGLWVQDGYNDIWEGHHGQTTRDYQTTYDACVKKGMRPIHISGYQTGNSHRIASIFARDKYSWKAGHDMTGAQYQKMCDEWNPKGFHPHCVSAYSTGSGIRFAAIFIQDKVTQRVARHGLSSEDYQKNYVQMRDKGFRLEHLCGYLDGKELRYACVFYKPPVISYPLPVSGTAVPSLAAYDDAMQKFMQQRHIQCGTLAVSKGGKLLLSRGYGYIDREGVVPCTPTTPMRTASIVKAVTLSAVHKLIREGKIKADTKIVSYLGIKAPAGKTMDKRWNDITVQHLIDHKGGWLQKTAKIGDPMFQSLKIAKELGKNSPPSSDDIISYMAGQPLEFTPGTDPKVDSYSNFGYCILGRVIEKASGKKYIDYINSDIAKPLGITSFQLARTLPANRNSREPVYLDPGFSLNVFNSKSKALVHSADGGFCTETMDAHGGQIASAPDMAKFMENYWVTGQPRNVGEKANWLFYGGLPGTHTMTLWREDGVNIVVLFNQRTDTSKLDYNLIESVMTQATASIKTWPK
jgi:CubicO group peptidase (beta-lactamase class C family)